MVCPSLVLGVEMYCGDLVLINIIPERLKICHDAHLVSGNKKINK